MGRFISRHHRRRPRSTSIGRIYHIGGAKLNIHDDSRVELIGVYTQLADVRDRGCSFPAHMRAPAGLVIHHHCGRWFLPVKQGEQIRIDGLMRGL